MAIRLSPVLIAGVLLVSLVSAVPSPSKGDLRSIGVAKVDITPDYPIRLSGYAARKGECEGVAQRIWAKALAIGSDKEGVALLLSVDNCGVPASVRDELVRRMVHKKGIAPERVSVCSTHTHSAPWLKDYLPNLFLGPLPQEQTARIERYTSELTDALEAVALQAMKDRRPGRLSHGKGEASFGANRRTKGGPTDPDVPVMVIRGKNEEIRGVLANYACHCTTLTGEFNQICGDWAGYAQESLEREYPGSVAMITIGCGGDINPNPRPGFELAKQHGEALATAVKAAVAAPMSGINGRLTCTTRSIELPFDTLPTREEWVQKAQDQGYVGQHARLNLARLERGEKLTEKLPYLLQTWAFGESLAMIFLPGEVVVDYALRLKRECDGSRLWINAYANDVPCYIPSERVLKEGGYEGAGAMVYYDKPTRFAPGVEHRIIDHVRDLLPPEIKTRTN